MEEGEIYRFVLVDDSVSQPRRPRETQRQAIGKDPQISQRHEGVEVLRRGGFPDSKITWLLMSTAESTMSCTYRSAR